MLFESAFDISCNTCVEVAFIILDNVDKPGGLLHASILTLMEKITIPFSEFSFSFARSGGAGGQNVNKVNSKVVLEWDINATTSINEWIKERFRARFHGFITQEGKVQLMSQKHRSQKDNIDDCISKLHDMIAEVRFPPKIRKATKPKKSAVLKRLNTKKKDGEKKRLRKKDF